MAYDEYLADRVRHVLDDKKVHFQTKKMMGGLIFLVDEKMLCGIHIDKNYGDSLLMARIGPQAYEDHIHKEECLPMNFTGRPMKGYIFVTPAGFDGDEDLAAWVQLALDYNPLVVKKKKK